MKVIKLFIFSTNTGFVMKFTVETSCKAPYCGEFNPASCDLNVSLPVVASGWSLLISCLRTGDRWVEE